MSSLRFGFCMLFMVTIIAGCSSPPPPEAKRAPVSGKVAFQGKPLPAGTITFDAKNGQAPAVFSITDGNYDGQCPIGNCKVAISAMRKVALKDKMMAKGPGYDQPMDEESLPARYNTKSEITKEVTAAGPNTFDFDLQAK